MRALRVIRQVEPAGNIHLDCLPFDEGQTVEIILLPVEDNMDDLTRLSESSLGFWQNEIDDEVWNDALPST